jgi:hypothetical protein
MRILASEPLIDYPAPGPALSVSDLQDAEIFFMVHLRTSFLKIKSHKEVTKQ